MSYGQAQLKRHIEPGGSGCLIIEFNPGKIVWMEY